MATKYEIRQLLKTALRELQPARNALKEATKPKIGVGHGAPSLVKCHTEVERAARALGEAITWLD